MPTSLKQTGLLSDRSLLYFSDWEDIITGTIIDYTGNGVNGLANVPYKVFKFAASGSIILHRPGFAELLVVGAGGASPDSGNPVMKGGGGGGGVISGTHWLEAGLWYATVGATLPQNGYRLAGQSSRLERFPNDPKGFWAPGGMTGSPDGNQTPLSGVSGTGMSSGINTFSGGGAATAATATVSGDGIASYISGSLAYYGGGCGLSRGRPHQPRQSWPRRHSRAAEWRSEYRRGRRSAEQGRRLRGHLHPGAQEPVASAFAPVAVRHG